uniref:Uncharacterized protein MANES_05G163500 n=1 Tax=Rhizophora mucronata TaxID=61149 RepID=A0A2P2QXB9_RHIMU
MYSEKTKQEKCKKRRKKAWQRP